MKQRQKKTYRRVGEWERLRERLRDGEREEMRMKNGPDICILQPFRFGQRAENYTRKRTSEQPK